MTLEHQWGSNDAKTPAAVHGASIADVPSATKCFVSHVGRHIILKHMRSAAAVNASIHRGKLLLDDVGTLVGEGMSSEEY